MKKDTDDLAARARLEKERAKLLREQARNQIDSFKRSILQTEDEIEKMQKQTVAEKVKDTALGTGVNFTVLAVLGLLSAVVFQPVRDWATGIAALPSDVRALKANDAAQDALLVLALKPDHIFNYRSPPRQVGACENGVCTIAARGSRDVRAADCQVVGVSLQITIGNAIAESVAFDGTVNADLYVAQIIETKYNLPRSVGAGEYEAILVTRYENCPWQDGGDPPEDEASETFTLTVT